jgi:hypothetical protein
LLGHAAGFKRKPLAAGKFDCHFMFHAFLISECVREELPEG